MPNKNLPTSSTTIDCLAGASKAIIIPLDRAINIICSGVINLNWVKTANKKADSIKAAWVKISIFLLLTLSAKTPPNRESTNIGIEPKKPTTPKRKAELVKANTNQLCATICIQVPTKDTNMPNQYMRKYLTFNEENIAKTLF